MRLLLLLPAAAVSLAAQNSSVTLNNTTRPGMDFQVGDKFEVVVTGAANQPISVRTTRHTLKTDWSPVIGKTDASGRWSVTGQFERADFGSWREVWTVGGKVAYPLYQFPVKAPCLSDRPGMLMASGPNESLTCDTATKKQEGFVTPSIGDSWRTPDGRVIDGNARTSSSAEQYQMEILEAMISNRNMELAGKLCAAAGDLIPKLVGVNALTGEETERVLAIIRAAYAPGRFHAPAEVKPGMLALLTTLGSETDQVSLKEKIDETMRFVSAQ